MKENNLIVMKLKKPNISECIKKYPVYKNGKQIGYMVPTDNVGEYATVLFEDIPYTDLDFKAMPVPNDN